MSKFQVFKLTTVILASQIMSSSAVAADLANSRLQHSAQMVLTKVESPLQSKTQILRVVEDTDKNTTCYIVISATDNKIPTAPIVSETAISCLKN